jgi:hypothetical protein
MKLGDFDRANQLVTDPLLASSRLVWVVTVHAKTPLLTRHGIPARSASVYTVVYDAVSGAAIEKGVNINFLRPWPSAETPTVHTDRHTRAHRPS